MTASGTRRELISCLCIGFVAVGMGRVRFTEWAGESASSWGWSGAGQMVAASSVSQTRPAEESAPAARSNRASAFRSRPEYAV
jgi:hypothetical protein